MEIMLSQGSGKLHQSAQKDDPFGQESAVVKWDERNDRLICDVIHKAATRFHGYTMDIDSGDSALAGSGFAKPYCRNQLKHES